MAIDEKAMLVKIGDENLTVGDPKEDVRGRKVIDRNGVDIGKVDDLLIDAIDKKVRLLQVGSGGFLGLGEKKTLIPVDEVRKVIPYDSLDPSVDRRSISKLSTTQGRLGNNGSPCSAQKHFLLPEADLEAVRNLECEFHQHLVEIWRPLFD